MINPKREKGKKTDDLTPTTKGYLPSTIDFQTSTRSLSENLE